MGESGEKSVGGGQNDLWKQYKQVSSCKLKVSDKDWFATKHSKQKAIGFCCSRGRRDGVTKISRLS